MSQRDSDFLHHGPCDNCGSSDANSHYSDGHEFCFSCGSYKHGDGTRFKAEKIGDKLIKLDRGEHKALPRRGLHLSTCQFFDYTVGVRKGRKAQFAPYYDEDGNLAGCHIKQMKNGKSFSWVLADGVKVNDLMPFGWQRWRHRTHGKIVVTEGEIDALSMSQVQDNEWPVVSIPTGAGPQVKKYMARHRDWFNRFDEIVLMFDMDEPGRDSAKAAAEVLGGKARIAELPMKDVNDMLVAEEIKALLSAMWNSQPYRPAEIVLLSSLRDKVLQGIEWGLSFPHDCMTKWTYGIRLGEIHTLGAGTGIGKTDLFTEIALHLVREHDEEIAMFMLEQEPHETAIRLAGKYADRRFHIPNDPEVPRDTDWTQEQLVGAYDGLVGTGKVYLYDSFGVNDWEIIRERIRFLRHSEGVRYFFLDHLTALADWQDNPNGALGLIMAEMGGLVKEIGCTIFQVSHLNTPKGTPHEEGGRVTIANFRNSRSIGFWSHFLWGMERNQQAEGLEERHTTTLRCLKDRYTGNGAGNVAFLGYDQKTGRLYEKPGYASAKEPDIDFDDETLDEGGDDF